MKSNQVLVSLLIGLTVSLTTLQGQNQSGTVQGFSIKLSPGISMYDGELSNDLGLGKRLADGSRFGFGASMIKQFTPYLGVQAQFMAGSLYSAATNNTFFNGAVNEFSLSARFDPLQIRKGSPSRFSTYLSAGIGTFSYRSLRRETGTNLLILPAFGYEEDGVTLSKKPAGLAIPVAAGISYQLLPFLQIELEHSLRFTNTDLIDCFKGTGPANDYYSLTSIGFRFSIPSKSDRLPAETAPKVDKTVAPKTAVPIKTPHYNLFVDVDIPESVKAGELFDVKLRINKGNYTGSLKLIQKLPEGFSQVRDLSRSTTFSFTGQNVLIEWEKLPGENIVMYNYQVKAGENLSGSQTLSGQLNYVEADSTKVISFNKSFVVEAPVIIKEDPAITAAKADAIEQAKEKESARGNIKPSTAVAGIEFRIQCGAFKENSSADVQLAKKYNITETIQEEFTNGWYKYTVGSFKTYEEAVKYRKSFVARTGLSTVFIVAYRDGVRLANIQEALK